MLGCLLAAVSYIPIYRAMQSAAGSNVVTASPVRNAITGSISLTPQTYVDGALQPAKQVLPYTDFASLISNPIAWKLILLVFIQVIFVTMVYGPIAAYLVEAFPARIRYTSLSLPYHIGNGVFGGLLPLIGLYVVAQTGNIYAGLYYPIIVAGVTFIVGSLLLKETRHVLIWDETESDHKSGRRISVDDRGIQRHAISETTLKTNLNETSEDSRRVRARDCPIRVIGANPRLMLLIPAECPYRPAVLLVAPVFFNLNEQFQVTAMPEQALDILPRLDADLFQSPRLSDHDLFL